MHPVFDSVRSGELDKALSLAESGVRDNPACPLQRSVLADVLMMRGELERAETHLNAQLRFDPSQQREVESVLQLLRAESDRQQVFLEGRTPEFILPPNEAMKMRVGAIAHRRSGNAAAADKLLLDAAAAEAEFVATVDEGPAGACIDWDSRFGAMIEVLSATGRYYWIPFEAVRSIELAPVRTLRDLAWRSAVITLGDGAAAPVSPPAQDAATPSGGSLTVGGIGQNSIFAFIPTRYPGSESHADGMLRAGIATEWTEPSEGVGIGMGQRVFLCGDATHALVSMSTLRGAGAAQAGTAAGGAVHG